MPWWKSISQRAIAGGVQIRWLAGFTDHQTRTGRAKYGGAGRVDVTPKVGDRKEARVIFGAKKLSCERRGDTAGKREHVGAPRVA